MLVCGSSKNWQVCRSSMRVIEVMGFVKVGSGREVVDAILGGGLRGGGGETMVRAPEQSDK